jgi:uncharacterized membrane protein YkoI
MKSFIVLFLMVALTCAMGQGKLESKITKDEATKIALGVVKGGVVKESELEKEGGTIVWSFDIAVGKNITEVWVDANTGKVLKNEVETPKKEANEKALDKAEKAALKSMPGEVVKAEAKTVKGKRIYSVEIKAADGAVSEVDVDGKTFRVMGTEKEEAKVP